MSGACRSCGAEIQWAMTAKKHRVPLDPDPVAPDAPGALVLVEDVEAVVWAYGLSDLAERMSYKLQVSMTEATRRIVAEYNARLSHFATCPNAARHRRRKEQPNS